MQTNQILKWTAIVGVFLVPFIPFLVFSHLFFPFITSKAFAFRIIVEIIFLAWAILALRDPSYRPKLNWINKSVFLFVFIIGLADLFGVAPTKSFWSNFERMEGFIALLHFALYFIVMTSIFRSESMWKAFWNTSLVASFVMVGYSTLQLLGAATINQGGVRVDGTFGNATYLAVYMLFHILLALYMHVRERKGSLWRWFYPVSILLNLIILYHTATRGAILGLMFGVGLIAVLLALGDREHPQLQKRARIGLVCLVLLVGLFVAVRNTSFVRESNVLSRFASISVEELRGQGRYYVWPMAVKGILDRPVLGWGQDNFNYVFNKYYDPAMYKQEPWFDRAHNILLDWGVAGGLLGLASYLLIFVALLYTIWKKTNFTYLERSVVTGLVGAYFFQNLFVFDNLISYVLFFSLLAHISSISLGEDRRLSLGANFTPQLQTASAILMVLLVVFAFYKWNVKPIKANLSLINALGSIQVKAPAKSLEHFKYAVNKSRLGRPETREQMVSNVPNIAASSLTPQEKTDYFAYARDQIIAQAEEGRSDTRYHLMAGSMLSQIGEFEGALTHLNKAKELTPTKQMIGFEIGAIYLAQKDYPKALEEIKRVYELAPEYEEAELIYLLAAIYAGDMNLSRELIAKIDPATLVADDRIARALLETGRLDDLLTIVNERIKKDPENPQNYITLASIYLEAGRKNEAIATLTRIGELFPQYKAQADAYIEEVKKEK